MIPRLEDDDRPGGNGGGGSVLLMQKSIGILARHRKSYRALLGTASDLRGRGYPRAAWKLSIQWRVSSVRFDGRYSAATASS